MGRVAGATVALEADPEIRVDRRDEGRETLHESRVQSFSRLCCGSDRDRSGVTVPLIVLWGWVKMGDA